MKSSDRRNDGRCEGKFSLGIVNSFVGNPCAHYLQVSRKPLSKVDEQMARVKDNCTYNLTT